MPGYLQILSSGFSWHLPVVDLTSSRRIPAQPYTTQKKGTPQRDGSPQQGSLSICGGGDFLLVFTGSSLCLNPHAMLALAYSDIMLLDPLKSILSISGSI